MLGVIGTLPVDNPDPGHRGGVVRGGRTCWVDGHVVDVARGTPALLAAAAVTARALGKHPPMAWLVGDIGQGGGSRVLYAHLCDHLAGCGLLGPDLPLPAAGRGLAQQGAVRDPGT